MHALRLAEIGERGREVVERRQRLKCRDLAPPVHEVGGRHRALGVVGTGLPHHHEPIRIAIGQRAQDDVMQDAEDGGVGANPEGQREHGGQRQGGPAHDLADAEAEIGEHVGVGRNDAGEW